MDVNFFMDALAALGWIPSSVGLWFVWKQIKLMREQNKITEDNVKRDTAIKVAKEFAELIDGDLGFCSNYLAGIYEDRGNPIDFENICHFDVSEMNKLCNKKDIDFFERCIKSPSDEQFIFLSDLYTHYFCESQKDVERISIYNQCNWKLTNEENKIINQKTKDLDEETQKKQAYLIRKHNNMIYYHDKILSQLSSSLTYTLNKLEYMCMYFTTNMADDNIVYKSLHQLFLKNITLLYIYIARRNNSNSDKYYCHIIELFRKWRNRYINDSLKEANASRDAILIDSYPNYK